MFVGTGTIIHLSDTDTLKGLLAVPFVLHSQPTAVFEPNGQSVDQQASVAQRRYAEIFRDVEDIINDHSKRISGACLTCF